MTGFVYKWTNTINGKWYIGSHKGTPDDGYRHSSKILKVAEEKYGIENFAREILFEGDYEKDNIRSVVEGEFLRAENAANNPMSYNRSNLTGPDCFSKESRMKMGKAASKYLKGKTYEEILGSKEKANQKKNAISINNIGKHSKPKTQEHKDRLSLAASMSWKKNPHQGMTDRHHTPETLCLLSEIKKKRPSPGMRNKHHTPEAREKIRQRAKEQRWTEERRERTRETLSKKRWYTNGEITIFVDKGTQPVGFFQGRKIKNVIS